MIVIYYDIILWCIDIFYLQVQSYNISYRNSSSTVVVVVFKYVAVGPIN